MWIQRETLAMLLLMAVASPHGAKATCQAQESGAYFSNPADGGATAIVGHPFAATAYARTVRVLSSGERQFIRYNSYPFHIARDSDGRVRFESLGDPDSPDCDPLTSPKPPTCPAWAVVVFDPVAQTVADWPAGEMGAHVAKLIQLSAELANDAERLTSSMPDDQRQEPVSDQAKTSTQDLGEKMIEGVRATGTRTTTLFPPGYGGNPGTTTRIHEVWISADMDLVIRVVDGDPHGMETESGVEHISLAPDADLFVPPSDYKIQHAVDDRAADWAIHQFAGWFVSRD